MSAPDTDFVAEGERRLKARLAEIDAARAEALRLERLHDAAAAMLAMLQRIVAADDAALKDLATLGLDVSAGPAALMTKEIRAVISLAIRSTS